MNFKYIILFSLIWAESSYLFAIAEANFERLTLFEKILYITYGLPGIVSLKLEWLFYDFPNIPRNFLPNPFGFLISFAIITLPGIIFSFLLITIALKIYKLYKK